MVFYVTPKGLLEFLFFKKPQIFERVLISGTKNIAQLLDQVGLAQQITNSRLILTFDLCFAGCIC